MAVKSVAFVLAWCVALPARAAAANSRTLNQYAAVNLNTSDTPVTLNATTAGRFARFLVVGGMCAACCSDLAWSGKIINMIS